MNDIENNMMKDAIHADRVYYDKIVGELLKNIAIICNSDNMHVKQCDLIHYELECDRLHDKAIDDDKSILLHARQDCIQKRYEISTDLFRNI